jgi:hypothetical protein
MVTGNKKNVQFVISHLEGCSGNFLGYLIANAFPSGHSMFRIDGKLNDRVLSVDGRTNWQENIDLKLRSHNVVVTHNYNQEQIQSTFPNAQQIHLYPYTHIGNVLYNVFFKKLHVKLENVVDNYFLDTSIWFEKIQQDLPAHACTDYWELYSKDRVEELIGSKLSIGQSEFFDQYWSEQLPYELNWPNRPMTIAQLVEFWKIENGFSLWLTAWTIFVYERVNGLKEADRTWTINDADKFDSWNSLQQIERQYQIYHAEQSN